MRFKLLLYTLCLLFAPHGAAAQTKAQGKTAVEELWIQNGERRIYGITSTPVVERKKVAVVCHGSNGTHHFGRNFFLELRKMKDVYKKATCYEGPVQIIHGNKDSIVPLSDSERLMKLYRQAHIGVIPGAGHGFNAEQRKVSNAFVHEFLE